MSTRATKSGINRETQAKLDAKYDKELAQQCLEWIHFMVDKQTPGSADFSTDGDSKNFYETLKNGQVLARFCNTLKPGAVTEKKIAGAKMAFKQMELISMFIELCKEFGVPDHENFATVDLYEQQNLCQVVNCIQSLGRKAKAKGLEGFGPKESEENKREFTEEQLKAGQGVIGLQMGTNKGASQAGMTMGKQRMIID